MRPNQSVTLEYDGPNIARTDSVRVLVITFTGGF